MWAFLHACSIANAESKKLAQSRAGNAHLRCRFLLVVLLPSSILDVHVIQIHLPFNPQVHRSKRDGLRRLHE